MSADTELLNELVWTPALEQTMANYGDQAQAFVWMHSEAYTYHFRKARNLTIIIAVANAISAISNTIVGDIDLRGFRMNWLFGIFAAILSVLTFLQYTFKYTTSATTNQISIQMWIDIGTDIEALLAMPAQNRGKCSDVFNAIIKQRQNATKVGNAMIPHHIICACATKYQNVTNFDLPDICGNNRHTCVYIEDVKSTPISPTEVPLLQ